MILSPQMVRPLTLTALALAFAACAAFGSASDPDVVMVPDGGSTPTGAVDASNGEGDGAVAQPDGGTPPTGFCATSNARFCTSFDTGDSPFGFATASPSAGAFAVAAGHSPPNAFVVSNAGEPDAGTVKYLAWLAPVATSPSSFEVRFQLKLGQLAPSGSSDAVLLRVDCGTASRAALKVNTQGKLSIQTDDDSDSSDTALLVGAWNALDITWSAAAGVVAVNIGPTGATISAALDPCEAPVSVAVGFKTWNAVPKGPYTIHFDDFELFMSP